MATDSLGGGFLTGERVIRRLAAILATDVAGYSRLMGRDEQGTLARLKAHRIERLEPVIAHHGGRLVKLTGDGALVEFLSAVDAVGAAIEFQQAMADVNKDQSEESAIVFRIGLHLGDLIVDGDDLYGDGVNVASRLESAAPLGGIIVSRAVREAVQGRLKAKLHALGELALKNIDRPVRAFRVEWDPSDWKLTAAPRSVPPAVTRPSTDGGNIAHEINNILMVIMANVEELQEDKSLSATRREQLDSIAASGHRAADLTRRLLAFSSQRRLRTEPTDVTDLVAGIDPMLRRALGEQIEVESVLAENLWTANIDRSQLVAALVILCIDARDTMAGRGRLLIETINAELDEDYAALNPNVVPGPYIVLAITNTGTISPREVMDKGFDTLFTTKEGRDEKGLGLGGVRDFIKRSNGDIKIYSEVGRGTTIRLYMPRSDEPLEVDTRSVAPSMPRGTERILLVDDDDQVRAALCTQLRSLDYVVEDARSGRKALDRLERGESFDLMLTDVVMPDLDGQQLAKIAAARWPAMKVIFMSGLSERAAINYGYLSSEGRSLFKPFRKFDLAVRLREVLDRL